MKRALSLVVCFTMILSMLTCAFTFTSGAAEVDVADVQWSQNQLNIVDRANYMYDTTWVCKKTVAGWGGTFYEGNTYRIPYGQPVNTGKYVGFEKFGASREEFLQAAADPNSLHYTKRSTYNKESTYYCNDCSAFVSYAWGISRNTTSSLPNKSTNLGKATESNIRANLQLGDALNYAGSHVVLVTGITYSGSTMTQIEITEQTPPQLKRSYYTPSSLASKYSSKYSILRYTGAVAPAPDAVTTLSPETSLDVVEGRTGGLYVRGWAFDKDDTSKELDVHVYIGGPVGVGEGHVIKADSQRTDVNSAYGCGDNHGFDAVIPTALSGEQTVYLYAIDDSGANDNTFMGSTTVNITADTENPVAGELKLVSSDASGYTVSADVSDNGIITKVLLPTWTDANVDNKIWYEGKVEDGKVTFTVPVADFDNYGGTYYTHLYVYDSADNFDGDGSFETVFHNPTGSVDVCEGSQNSVSISGWALDGDAGEAPINIHVYIGGGPGVGVGHSIVADAYRADIAALGYGTNHGFSAVIPTSFIGEQVVYIYAENVSNGGNVLLATKTVTITTENEVPVITDAQIIEKSDGTGYTVKCKVNDNIGISRVLFPTWCADSTGEQLWYEGTVDGEQAYVEVEFADFDNAQGVYATHIYAYDVNNNVSAYPLSTTYYEPVGYFDLAEDACGAIRLKGWGYDRDTPQQSIEIHLYIGEEAGRNTPPLKIKTDLLREDVNSLHGLSGNHGFDITVDTQLTGEQTVYMYVINNGNGTNQFVSSKTVTITQKPEAVKGDVDSDGVLSIMDATLIQYHLASLETLSQEQLAVADADLNGEVDILDATYIQKTLAGLV